MIRWPLTGAGFLCLFIVLGVVVAKHPLALDLAVTGAFYGLWRGTLGQVTSLVSDLLGIAVPAVVAIGLLTGAILAWYRGSRREAWLVARALVVYGAARLTSWLAKPLFLRQRPREYAEFSYPSGHVVAIASSALALVLLCRWLAPAMTRWAALASSLVTAVVALTRLLLGVHWLTDTVGAVLGVLGTGLLAASVVRLLPGPISGPAHAA
ncbi:phosphatase PAP2 family protein [Amycolatopsis alkalitolerans]|uniref:Phosphatase PAP2 family protein n=1 Tax=Amycolatopsis alkalitolerans TaxID=2547244 RepID=A0A5C4LYT8_9PSEU|nr:phosphatase PAP2 family protein [Amycolatopsis alkalitolerans]TNC22334.1 phosphatase PAP2 family protein [Amycolatopsis alkalitolerans]